MINYGYTKFCSFHTQRQRRVNPVANIWMTACLLLLSSVIQPDQMFLNWIVSGRTTSSNALYGAEPEPKGVDKYDRNVSGPGKIKLNYYSASWQRVIQDLTDAFQMEFVGDQLPTGRFSRNDHAEHTRKDAIRIINHEIEPQGFRLVEKGPYLILLETTLRRPQAPTRPTVASTPKKLKSPVEEPSETNDDHQPLTDQPNPPSNDQEPQAKRPTESRPVSHSRPVRQVSFQAADDEPQTQLIQKLVTQIENWPKPDSPQVHLVQLKNVQAKPTAELLSMVFEAPVNTAVGSDQPRNGLTIVDLGNSNSLLILASESELEAIVDLAVKIDVPADSRAEFQIFRWRAAHVMDVEAVIAELSQQRRSLAGRSLLIASPQSNSIVARARPQDLDEIELWINKKHSQLTR